MHVIEDDRFCATLTIYLTVGCFIQWNTSMEITGKRFFQTTPFNLHTTYGHMDIATYIDKQSRGIFFENRPG